jgi:hypothetical protein
VSASRPDLFEVIFGVPPSTPTIPVDPPARADFARGIAERHRAMFNALVEIGADNGGGLMGRVKGLLAEYSRRSMISERDRDRLYEVFDLLAKVDTMPGELDRLVQVNDEILNDLESSEIAMVVAAVALDGVTSPASKVGTAAAQTAGVAAADAAGFLVGSPFGPLGSLAGGVAASLAADDHVMST